MTAFSLHLCRVETYTGIMNKVRRTETVFSFCFVENDIKPWSYEETMKLYAIKYS